MEVIPRRWQSSSRNSSILHVCGGDPMCCKLLTKNLWVFSTYVEVILPYAFAFATAFCILHVCGGDPSLFRLPRTYPEYSPRMWRWSLLSVLLCLAIGVFSTYVEVILLSAVVTLECPSILHVCGGDPYWSNKFSPWIVYSPRMWRWSLQTQFGLTLRQVFSTYVEVIPDNKRSESMSVGILHVCGGDPIKWQG